MVLLKREEHLPTTHQEKVLSKAQRAANRANGLQHVALLLANAHSKQRVAQVIINEGFKVLGAHNGDITLLDNDKNIEVVAAKGYPKNFKQKMTYSVPDIPSLTAKVIKTKKALYIKNVDQLDERYQTAKEFIISSGAHSAALLPLTIDKKIIGVLQFTFTTRQVFSREDKIFIQTLAHQCAQTFERVAIREELEESKEQLEIILENTADGIIVQNDRHHVVYMNDVGSQIFGKLSKKSTKPVRMDQLIDQFEILNEVGEECDAIVLPAYRAMKEKISVNGVFKFIHKKNHSANWYFIKANPIFKNKKISLVICTFQDITRVKELDQRKDDFINMASHELKTPLTSMRLFLDMLSLPDQIKDKSQASIYLQKAKQQSEKLERLATDLLSVSRMQKGKIRYHKKNFDLGTLIKTTIDELQLATPDHKIILKKSCDCSVYGDEFRIYQVITNLITNAAKYSPKGKEIHVLMENEKKVVTVSVKDFGIGISKEDQDKIFERFYQASDAVTKTNAGLGMGLYIANEIIRHHKGTLTVESQKGKGSTFSFTLPVKR